MPSATPIAETFLNGVSPFSDMTWLQCSATDTATSFWRAVTRALSEAGLERCRKLTMNVPVERRAAARAAVQPLAA